MDNSSGIGGGMCESHRRAYVLAIIDFKQRVLAGAAYVFGFQFCSTIVAIIVSWGFPANHEIWSTYFQFWSAAWPTYILGTWTAFAWRFRGSQWACADEDALEFDTTEDDDNGGNVLHFRATKFSNN